MLLLGTVGMLYFRFKSQNFKSLKSKAIKFCGKKENPNSASIEIEMNSSHFSAFLDSKFIGQQP